MRNLISLVFVAALMGCATPMTSQRTSLDTQPSCCTGLADVTYKPMAFETEVNAAFESSSPVFAFPTGKSYFSAVTLAPGKSRGIRVSSFFNGMWVGQYFQPIFLFLDDQKKPLSSVTPNLRYQHTRLTADAQMIGGVRVPDDAAYAIVYTRDFSDTKVTAVIPGSASVFMVSSTPVLVQNPATGKNLELSPTGELRLRLETIQPQ